MQTLQWVYGISDVPSNIANLSDDQNDRVAVAAAHTAVIYDRSSGSQTFLQVTGYLAALHWCSDCTELLAPGAYKRQQQQFCAGSSAPQAALCLCARKAAKICHFHAGPL